MRLKGSDLMESQSPPGPTTLMWTWELFRCEHRQSDTGSWLVLFHRDDEVLRLPLVDAADAGAIAAEWLRSRRGDTPAGLPEPSRRRVADRRKASRGGRRDAERQRQARENKG